MRTAPACPAIHSHPQSSISPPLAKRSIDYRTPREGLIHPFATEGALQRLHVEPARNWQCVYTRARGCRGWGGRDLPPPRAARTPSLLFLVASTQSFFCITCRLSSFPAIRLPTPGYRSFPIPGDAAAAARPARGRAVGGAARGGGLDRVRRVGGTPVVRGLRPPTSPPLSPSPRSISLSIVLRLLRPPPQSPLRLSPTPLALVPWHRDRVRWQ